MLSVTYQPLLAINSRTHVWACKLQVRTCVDMQTYNLFVAKCHVEHPNPSVLSIKDATGHSQSKPATLKRSPSAREEAHSTAKCVLPGWGRKGVVLLTVLKHYSGPCETGGKVHVLQYHHRRKQSSQLHSPCRLHNRKLNPTQPVES